MTPYIVPEWMFCAQYERRSGRFRAARNRRYGAAWFPWTGVAIGQDSMGLPLAQSRWPCCASLKVNMAATLSLSMQKRAFRALAGLAVLTVSAGRLRCRGARCGRRCDAHARRRLAAEDIGVSRSGAEGSPPGHRGGRRGQAEPADQCVPVLFGVAVPAHRRGASCCTPARPAAGPQPGSQATRRSDTASSREEELARLTCAETGHAHGVVAHETTTEPPRPPRHAHGERRKQAARHSGRIV
jgi:hypothetical protein